MYFNGIFLLKWWSVRVYNLLLRYNLEIRTSNEAIALGDSVRDGKYRNFGRQTAIELYRGAGLGIYPIYKRININQWGGFHITLDRVRELCIQYDEQFTAIN